MNEEKTSSRVQWQETQAPPVAAKPMSKQDIEAFSMILSMSYKCSSEDITWRVDKICNEITKEVDTSAVMLVYRMKQICLDENGQPETDANGYPTNRCTSRIIYQCKLPIPEDVKRRVSELNNTARPPQQGAKPSQNGNGGRQPFMTTVQDYNDNDDNGQSTAAAPAPMSTPITRTTPPANVSAPAHTPTPHPTLSAVKRPERPGVKK